jgi:uncharacterized membrane protein YjgN (DUF898 family)
MAPAAPLQLEPTYQPPSAANTTAARGTTTAKSDQSGSALSDDKALAFEFTGSGSEYFRIWVVNLLLTILTLGIYSAWAKVRRLRYFYRNTRLDGAIFDYHGNPKAILKGRVLAIALVAAYKIASDISIVATIAVVLILVGITPWLLARSFRFKLYNSSYRGLRFHFEGTVGQAYRTLILFPMALTLCGVFVWSVVVSYGRHPGIGMVFVILLPVIALAITVPLAHYLLKRYQHDNACFGQAPFFFDARARDFFKVYGRAVGLVFLGGVLAQVFVKLTGFLFTQLSHTMFGWLFTLLYGLLGTYVSYLLVRPFIESRIQNLVWNATELGMHRFESHVSARRLLWIHASNLFLIALTLGLYKPFATIRLLKYRIESMAITSPGDLEDFFADQSNEEAGALGQEAGDLFDIEIAL